MYSTFKVGDQGAVSPVNFQIIAWVRDLFKSLHKGEKKNAHSRLRTNEKFKSISVQGISEL